MLFLLFLFLLLRRRGGTHPPEVRFARSSALQRVRRDGAISHPVPAVVLAVSRLRPRVSGLLQTGLHVRRRAGHFHLHAFVHSAGGIARITDLFVPVTKKPATAAA